MLIEEDVKYFIENKLLEIVNRISKSRDVFRFQCPLCGDSKKSRTKVRGNYYRSTGTYYCFNCGESRSGLYIIADLGDIDINEVKKEYLQSLMSGQIKPIATNIFVEKKTFNQDFEVPDNWIDIPRLELQKFILNRKILEAKGCPKNWRFYYNKDTDRIVIPWIKNDKIVYYQERAIRDWQYEKYRFPKDYKKDIFGLDTIDINWKYIFFQEGAFDSIFIPNAIAIGGIFPNNDQLKELEQLKIDQELVWFPDNPWVDESSKKKIIKYSKKYPSQKIYMWDKSITAKDVNELVLAINDVDFFFNNKKEIEKKIITLSKACIILKFNTNIL